MGEPYCCDPEQSMQRCQERKKKKQKTKHYPKYVRNIFTNK